MLRIRTSIILFLLVGLMLSACRKQENTFSPLSEDNSIDRYVLNEEVTLIDRSSGEFVKPTLPLKPQERTAYYIENIAHTTRSTSSPLGLALTTYSIELLRQGRETLPKVREAFDLAVLNPDKSEDARYLSCVLGRFHDSASFERLALADISHPSESVRRACIWSLPRISRKDSVPLLTSLLLRPNRDGDADSMKLVISAALSVATGQSYPLYIYDDPGKAPVAKWEDSDKWKIWALAYWITQTSLPLSVKNAFSDLDSQNTEPSGSPNPLPPAAPGDR